MSRKVLLCNENSAATCESGHGDCIVCDEGKYTDSPGMCVLLSFYLSNGNVLLYTENFAATCLTGRTVCTDCPAGTYADSPGMCQAVVFAVLHSLK